jgi:putative membrane protein
MRASSFAVCGALLAAACGPQPQGPQAAAAQADRSAAGPAPSAIVQPPTPEKSAQDFVTKAAGADAFEIEAARQAMQRATNGDVKAFAAMMLRDHQKSSSDLRKAVAGAGQTLSVPGAPPADLQAALARLGQADPTAFDRAYMTGQLGAHQAALTLLQDYAQNGDVVALKAFAAEASPVVQSHYQAAKSLHDALK